MTRQKALILGGRTGLLGQAMTHTLAREGWSTLKPFREELDFFDQKQLEKYLDRHEVELVVNAVAFKDVERAEDEQDQANLLNRELPRILGSVCSKRDVYLLHFSTGLVFDGKKKTPYTTEDQTGPATVYGKSKLAGEKFLLENSWEKLLIVRTSWLFGPFKTNFVHKILDMAQAKKSIDVIHDQVGSPTNTLDLGRYSLELVKKQTKGIYHVANKGQATWCELASESISCAGLNCRVNPISSRDCHEKAKRPSYSVLDCSKFSIVTGVQVRPWVQALRDYIYYFQDRV